MTLRSATKSNLFSFMLIAEFCITSPFPKCAVAPINNIGLIVTEERFIFALGSGGNPRKISWCDRENNTVWSPLATNEAGDYELQTSGEIQTAVRTRGQTLILTDVDSYTARYSGPPYIFGFERVGTNGCSY